MSLCPPRKLKRRAAGNPLIDLLAAARGDMVHYAPPGRIKLSA